MKQTNEPILRGILSAFVVAFVVSMTSTVDALTFPAPFESRPIALGKEGSNITPSVTTLDQCVGLFGTFGVLVADQSSNQYILSVAHVFALNPTGYFSSGSLTPVFQPDVASAASLEGFSSCQQWLAAVPSFVSKYAVANLITVLAPNFTAGSISPAEAVLLKIIPGKVSNSIANIPVFNSVPLTVYKKHLHVQMQGAASGHETNGRTISKMLMPTKIKLCQHQPTAGNVKSCAPMVVTLANSFEVTPSDFATDGDSGALVLTVGPCPQPIGMLEGSGFIKNSTTRDVVVESVSKVLQALQTAGGYSSLSIVPGGGGCGSNLAEVGDGGTPETFTLEDVTAPDSDVAQALAVLPDVGFGFLCSGRIAGVGIDLSGSKAALDVVVNSTADLDPYHICIPTSFEGVPMEQDVIKTIVPDSSAIF